MSGSSKRREGMAWRRQEVVEAGDLPPATCPHPLLFWEKQHHYFREIMQGKIFFNIKHANKQLEEE